MYICMRINPRMKNKSLPHSIQVNGKLIELSSPKVMGIVNITPDSFYSNSRAIEEREIAERVEHILN